MDVGIGLPATIPDVDRASLLDDDPDRAVPQQRRDRRQAGGDARPPLERPVGLRRRGGRARGRLRRRGRRLPHAREAVRRDAGAVAAIWSGEEFGTAGAIGPRPPRGRPALYVGGGVDAAFERAARHADGWVLADAVGL